MPDNRIAPGYAAVPTTAPLHERQPLVVAGLAVAGANLLVRGLLAWGITLTADQQSWITDVVQYGSIVAGVAWAWWRVQPVRKRTR